MLRAAVLMLVFAASASAQVADTINKKTPLLVGKDALLLGVFAIGTAAVAPIDMQIANRLQDPGAQENRFLRTAATGFRLLGDPGSVVTGLGIYGVGRIDGQRRVQALGLHSVESILLASSLATGLKLMAGAAIGTIIGLKVVKYTHSHPGNQLDSKLIRGRERSQLQINPVLFSIQF